MSKGKEIFEEGVQAMLLSQPFFGSLLMKMKHEELPADSPHKTLFVDGRRIAYNPEFMAKQTAEQALFCVAHEVLHTAWMHLDRMRHYVDCKVGPDGKPLDMDLFNKALDYPINASLVESKIGKPPKMGGLGRICLDPERFPPTMTPEEVYCLLKQGSGGGSSGGGSGESGQQSMDAHGPADPNDPQRITAADVQQAANICKAMRGSLPAGIDRLLGELTRPSESPWRVLRALVVSSLRGHDASTWRRLNRRLVVRGIGVPGRTAHGAGTIGIVVDTSGSIGEEMLTLFGSHMAAIIEDARPKLVKIYWTDAEVHRVDEVASSTDLRNLLTKPVPGGGGTDMREGVAAAEKDKCDSVVVLTDGYTPFCDGATPVFWAITTTQVSPHGRTIHITG